MSTFHSLCASLLRFSADQIGLNRNFSIYDRDDQLRVVKAAMKRLEISTTEFRPSTALNKISNAKNRLWHPADFAAQAVSFRDEQAASIYKHYQEALESNAAMDFDDLLLVAARLLEDDERFRSRWQARFDYLLIDEYQDTNRAQYLIAQRLAAEHRNLCATGDADQAIYGWRGADIRNILDFQKDYPDARVVKLEQNYRSTQIILDAANSLIARNAQRHARDLWTEKDGGVPVAFHFAPNADAEADDVLTAIRQRVKQGRTLGHFAIFYRTNAQSRAFEEAFRRANMPHRLVGAVAFYSRQEIKDVLAFLRAVVNPRDDLSLERIINTPSRGIGKTTVQRLKAWAAEQGIPLSGAIAQAADCPELGTRAVNAVSAFAEALEELRGDTELPVPEFCQLLLERTGYSAWLEKPENEERQENVQEFLAKATNYQDEAPEPSLENFLQEISLVCDVDNLEEGADAVTLMTLHAAKGLEFPVVFLTGLEEGLLPHANAVRTEDSLWGEDREKVEEERRLCYVGMTRAQDELILTAAQERTRYNRSDFSEPSRFLGEIADEVFDEESRAVLSDACTDAFALDAGPYAPVRPQRPKRSIRRKTRPSPPGIGSNEDVRLVDSSSDEETSAGTPSANHFAVGDWVRHAKYGLGRIESLKGSGKNTLATLSLNEGGKRIFALEHAPLEKL